jgi:precorrin-8X/cobalt-precorrin-8 methylmutase
MASLHHPILKQSFAVIDQEFGEHSFSEPEYAVVRRVIHSTADFDYKHLVRFSPGAIEGAIAALRQQVPIVTDVSMVKQGVVTLVAKTFNNPVISAVEQVEQALPGKTRTETGLLHCWRQFPQAIYVIGNAPTALLALCGCIQAQSALNYPAPVYPAPVYPALVIAAPVGFISVLESKVAIANTPVPQIRVEGRKGGSPVAAAILNALLVLAYEG